MDRSIAINIIITIIITTTCYLQDSWGYIEPYLASYLYYHNEENTTANTHILYYILMSQGIVAGQIFIPISEIFGYRGGIALSCFIFAFGMFICYLVTSLYMMCIGFIFIGIGMNLLMIIPGFLIQAIMPEKPALASA